MAKENKLGTFGGVFTPSLLTILGVIMYLRLPWVIGHAGLGGVIGIILVAHIISVATGLSISSIATDKNVGAGGPYYIVSRSMGLPIGGALGMALFVGLCFGTSLYVIGLTESVLDTFGVEPTPTAIRIVGTISLVVITGVTVISTAFAIKLQYWVLAAIVLSIVGILLGDSSNAVLPSGEPEATPPMAFLFGIFFPAVTGFTAGVNMSGDLKDPKKAIPTGTMAAILVGLFVYIGLAIFLHLRVPAEALIGDPNILPHMAFKLTKLESSVLVIGGIWAATFSSGLGSIMGAPRILQALSTDRITPAIFAKGKGPTKEPRNALVLAFLLAEAGVLIAELNAIARIVSMVFLTMYGFLNLTCAIEAKVSPDFRPTFRVPATVSIVGAVTCVVIMILLDLPAMIGACALMVGLFAYLQRKQLKLESGDAWGGVWSSLVRSGLFRIAGTEEKLQRNWSPNILAFHGEGLPIDQEGEFSEALMTGSGIVTRFRMVPRSGKAPWATLPESGESESKAKQTGEKEKVVGLFERDLVVKDDPFEDIQTLCRHYGFAGLEPNTLLLPWHLHQGSFEKFAETIDQATEEDFNVLIYKGTTSEPDEKKAASRKSRQIDIWWRVDEGNVAFNVALLRFLTRAPRWENPAVRFILLSADSANNDNLRSTMRRFLRDNRVEASVKIENDSFADRRFVDRVRNVSEGAALTLIGLPNEVDQIDGRVLDEMEELCEKLERVLFFRASGSFPEVLPTGRAAAVSELPPVPGSEVKELPRLELSPVADIASATTEYSEAFQRLVGRLSDQCLSKVYGRHVELIRKLKRAAERHLEADKALKAGNPRRQRTAFNRQQSSFLLECKDHLEHFAEAELPDLRSILEGGLDAFLHDDGAVSAEENSLLVARRLEDFQADEKDSAYVRRFKRQMRWSAWLRRRAPQYRIPTSQLQRFYFARAVDELLAPSLKGFVTESHQLLVQTGKLLNSSRAHVPEGDQEIELAAIIEAQKTQLIEHLDDLDRRGKELLSRRRWNLLVDALTLVQEYGDDISRLDFSPHFAKNRTPPTALDTDELDELPGEWKQHQAQLSIRAGLALSLSGVQHRLTAIVGRERDALKLGMKNGAMSECQRVLEHLAPLLKTLDENEEATAADFTLHVDSKTQFDPQAIIESLEQECRGSSDELPTTLSTLTDESIQALEEGRLDAVEQIELPVKRLMQFLMETELVGGLTEALARVPQQEQRALGIAQDVVRLVNFQLSEIDTESYEPGELRAQLAPVIENGIERLTGECEGLSQLTSELLKEVDERLHLVIDGTNAYELSSAADRLNQHIRVRQGKRAVSGARGFLKRVGERSRSSVERLIYRKSEGILLTRRKGTLLAPEQAVDRIAAMVRRQVPQPEVLSSLPFYYRQIFSGQSGINDTFWVGRKEQLTKARAAIKQFDKGASGCLLVVGDRLSGKSALIQKMSADLFERRRIIRVHAPPGGSIDQRAFTRSLKKALGPDFPESGNQSFTAALSALPRGSVLIFDDLNLWWERSDDGQRLVQQVLSAIKNHGNRVLFVIGLETQAFHFINRAAPISDAALALLECGPLPAESLRSIVTLRHSSTGLKYKWGKKDEDELGSIALARLFSQHFNHSGGSVGATLRSWVASIDRVRGETLEITVPQRKDWEALDALRPSWVALLLQLLLHKQLGVERLRRVSGLSRDALKEELDSLERMGLIVESQRRVIEIEPGVLPALQERFSKQGLLA